MQAFKQPDSRFSNIHVDIVGPLPSSKGYTYLFTCVDRYTRWPEANPMTDATAASCASALLNGWVSRLGVPTTITSDQGQQFESHLWRALMNLLGSTRNRATAYHPQANGMVERFHRHLKTGLKARLTNGNWVDELPVVLQGIRTTLKEDLSCSAAKMVYVTTLRLPSTTVSRLCNAMQRQQFVPPKWHGKHDTYFPSELQMATHVYVRRDAQAPPLTRPYDGPYRVARRSRKHFALDVQGKVKEHSVDQLKPVRSEGQSFSTPYATDTAQSTPAASTTTTRSSRIVQRPGHLKDYFTD